ncbi:MAG: LPS-assembly protein LptD [Saccharospirillaceae bacterium]|nr:LPS-assembly protein LptD [Saccharospirillaceae bacterium]
MRYLLSMSFLLVCASASAKNLDLDFVPYTQLTDSQKAGVSKACSGQFVDEFKQYTQDVAEGRQSVTAKNQSFNGQNLLLEGEAAIIEQSIVLLSEAIDYNQTNGQSTLSGAPQLRFDGLLIQGESAQFDLKTHTGVIKNAKFIIHKSNINGSADEIRRDADGVFHLKGFTISRCNPDQRSWWLKGSNLKINPANGMITSVHNWLWVAGVPVFYTPYIHMPYDDHATGGLLVPSFTLSNGKISEFNQPIYFRFKPNLDLTSTISFLTHYSLDTGDDKTNTDDDKIIEDHGLLINNELRFLGWKYEGSLIAAYSKMPGLTQDDNLKTDHRYYLNLKQKWDFDWFTSDINLHALSDEYFLQDFYSGVNTTSADQSINNVFKLDGSVIKQSLIANWALENSAEKFHVLQHELNTNEFGWDMYFKQHWQEVDERKNDGPNAVKLSDFTFQLAPAFEANYQSKNTSILNFDQDVKFQVVNFDRQVPSKLKEEGDLTEQVRLAFKGTYSLPYQFLVGKTDATYELVPTVMLQSAVYPGFEAPLDIDENKQNTGYVNVLSTIKQNFKIPTAINEQDQIIWLPELIWQYAPLVDSSYLPVLDSVNSSAGFGVATRFTGLDRLGDTNAIHYSFSMKYQQNKKDYAQLSIKQSRFFEQQRLNLNSLEDVLEDDDEFEPFSDYLVQASLNPNSNSKITANWNFTPDWKIQTGEFALNYHLPNNQYVRFTSYSDYVLNDTQVEETQLSTRLLSLSGQWAVNHQIGLIGYAKWKFDINSEQSNDYELEEMAIGVEYDDCCWAVRMLSYNNFLDEEDLNNKIHFQIVFKGMGRIDQGFDATIDKYLPAYPGSLFEQD